LLTTVVACFVVSQRVRSSVARMGVPSIDLLQLHWEPPTPAAAGSKGSSSKAQQPPGFVAAAKVLKQLQQEGLIKHLGVSNFDVPMLLALLDAGVKPVSNQVRLCWSDRMRKLCG
jgi:diketogulonate reductase-like aldo/keto reductase